MRLPRQLDSLSRQELFDRVWSMPVWACLEKMDGGLGGCLDVLLV